MAEKENKKAIQKLNKKSTILVVGIACIVLVLVVKAFVGGKGPNLNTKDLKDNGIEGEQSVEETSVPSNGKTIIVDAGHGGFDPGKVGITGVLEKDCNLAIAMKLKDALTLQGYTVIMTREGDLGLYSESDKIGRASCRERVSSLV